MRRRPGPGERYTHWKQTVFYTKDTLTVKEGETIHGQLSCKPNDQNPRDLDITIQYRFQGEVCESQDTLQYHMC